MAMQSKILAHFVKFKMFLFLMDMIVLILGELEFLEGLVKVAWQCKNELKKIEVYVVYIVARKEVEVNLN